MSERTDDDESVEHCNRFLPQNVAGVTPELVEPARLLLFCRRLARRQLQRDLRVRPFTDERDAAPLEPLQCLLVACAARFGDPSVEPIEAGLEVGDGDPLRQDRPELGEARDRLLHVLCGDAQIESGVTASFAGRVVRGRHVAAELARLPNGRLRRAREVVDAEPHRDLLLLERDFAVRPGASALSSGATRAPPVGAGARSCRSTGALRFLPGRARDTPDDCCSEAHSNCNRDRGRERGSQSERSLAAAPPASRGPSPAGARVPAAPCRAAPAEPCRN